MNCLHDYEEIKKYFIALNWVNRILVDGTLLVLLQRIKLKVSKLLVGCT